EVHHLLGDEPLAPPIDVADGLAEAADELDVLHAGLLLELAQSRIDLALALFHAALGKLPVLAPRQRRGDDQVEDVSIDDAVGDDPTGLLVEHLAPPRWRPGPARWRGIRPHLILIVAGTAAPRQGGLTG